MANGKCEVNILGSVYSIKRKKLKDSDYDGFTDFTSRTIVVRKDNFNKLGNFDALMARQLRHEIIHAFMAESGLQSNFEHCTKFGHDETMIDWYAIQYPKIKEVFDLLGV